MMTPARRKRDLAKSDAEQRRIDEEKYVGFSVACNNDEANACHSLGEWYAVLRANFAKAAELYRPNCLERGYANSCFNLGLLFGESAANHSPRSRRRTAAQDTAPPHGGAGRHGHVHGLCGASLSA